MARGDRFNLAIPVLASIYRGVNDIANSSKPWKCDSVILVHYVYAWLEEYFNTHFGSDPKSAPQKPRMVRYVGERVAKILMSLKRSTCFEGAIIWLWITSPNERVNTLN